MKKRAIKLNVKDLSIDIKQAIKDDNLTIFSQKGLSSDILDLSMLYACINNKSNIVDFLFKKNVSLNSLDGQHLFQAVLHKNLSIVEYILENTVYSLSQLEKACTIAVKKDDVSILSVLNNNAKIHYSNFNLNFNHNVCMKLSIRNRHLGSILYLNNEGISPFSADTDKNYHLSVLIKRDDHEWIDFYIDKSILKVQNLFNDKYNLFRAIVISDNHYPKGLYYAEYFINKLNERGDSISDLKSLFKEINYIFPIGTEEKVAPLRNLMVKTINHRVLTKKLNEKDNAITKKIKI